MLFDQDIPKELFELGKKRSFDKNDNIFRIGNRVTHCYYILSGTVKIYIDHSNGRRSILDFAKKGDWLGELSLFQNEADIKENKVLEVTECIEFSLDTMRAVCLENAKISFYFASYISNKLLTRSYRMSENLNYSLEHRLADFILQYEQNGIYNISHIDVSEYMNVSYRHILYVIKQFCEAGILAKNTKKGYVVLNVEGLKRLREEDE